MKPSPSWGVHAPVRLCTRSGFRLAALTASEHVKSIKQMAFVGSSWYQGGSWRSKGRSMHFCGQTPFFLGQLW